MTTTMRAQQATSLLSISHFNSNMITLASTPAQIEKSAPQAVVVADTGSLPLASAVGTGLPLYQYPAAAGACEQQDSVYTASSDAEPLIVPDLAECYGLSEFDTLMESVHVSQKHGLVASMAPPVKQQSAEFPLHSSESLPSLQVPEAPSSGSLRRPWYTQRLSEPNFLRLAIPEQDDSCDPQTNGSSPMAASTMSYSRQGSVDMSDSVITPPGRSTLDSLVTALWEDCDARGLFRYDVSQAQNRVLPGQWGWVAQLNEGRGNKKRPTELKVDAVMQPFDAGKFNFGKAFVKEVLLQFEPLPAVGGEEQLGTWVANGGGARVVESSAMTSDPTLVMINVSPIDYGHILLVPHVLAQRPQQLTLDAVQDALAFTREMANPTFRLGYNSLGAYATINHLHFQGYYLPHAFPCERASYAPVPGYTHEDVVVSQLTDYPVAGWVVQARPGRSPRSAESAMAAVLMQICGELQAVDQPFNVLIVEQGARAFVWPQCYAERQAAGVVPEDMLETGVNPAAFEVAGHLILKRAEDFAQANDAWAQRLLAGVSLPPERFAQLTKRCLRL